MDAITEHHYKNIATGKAKPLDDGDLATVRTIIVEIDGVETLIPTIWDGEEVDDRTAIKFAQDSGVDWPTRTGPDAVAELQAFDEQIHLEMTDQTTPQEAARILSEKTPSFNKGGLMSGTAAYDNAALLDKEIAEAEAAGISQEPPTAAQLGSLALDFTPIIGDLKGGYETAVEISDELEKENPDYTYIGILAGAGTAAALVGLVPGLGDAAGKAIMNGAKSVADKMPEYDPNTVGMFGGNLFAKGYDELSEKTISPNRKMDISEYDAKWNDFSNLETPEQWQKAVKSYVKGSRDVDPVVRTPELEQSAKDLADDKISREQHLKNVEKFKPITAWDQLPREPSDKTTVFSLKPNQRTDGKFVLSDDSAAALKVTQSSLSIGDKFNGRLDIPAYKDYDTWIVAGTSSAEKGTHYAKAVHYIGNEGKPVKFLASQKMGQRIGTGEADKTGYATVSGWVNDLDADNIRNSAESLLNDPAWTQVGFDPRRQGPFYVRKGENTGLAVTEADEVIQLGPLVLAKNVKINPDYTGFALGGLAVARKGITTPEGLEMANKTTQLDRKKADKNNDGELSKYEETVGKAVQNAMADDPEQDEKVRMGHGGMAMMSDYDCGMMSDPMPIGATESEVADDISAMISENEYVLPANVVKWHGLKQIMAMQDEAEMGLMMMQEQGLIQEVSGEEDEYEHHMMYDPETGEGKMTKSYQDHLDLKNQGWGHESETEEESDSTGAKNAEVSDAGDSEQEEKETIETPEGNEIEVAGVDTVIDEQEIDETEEYKNNNYGKTSQMFGMMKKPKFSFIM